MPFLTAGYPSPQHTVSILQALVRGGADIIELGVPFSDPVADGPTIQKASNIALAKGTNLVGVLEIVREFRKTDNTTGIVLFGAYNPFLHYGFARFAKDAKEAGADGVLIPDVPADEADEIAPILKEYDLNIIELVAPTSTKERKKLICSVGTGFIYYISVRGVTGARSNMQFELDEPIAEIRACTDLPVAVGFGVSTPEQAADVAKVADGVVVGSALIDVITKNMDSENLLGEIESYMKSLKDAIV